MRAHADQSSQNLLFKRYTLLIEIEQDELVEALLLDIVACEQVKELICNLWSCIQALDVEAAELAHSQSSLNPVFDIVDYIRHRARDGLNLIDFELNSESFCFGGIKVDLFLRQTIEVFVVDSKHKSILGLWLVAHLNFWDEMQAADANAKGEKWVLRTLSLLGRHDMLANRQLGKLGLKVEKCWHANVLSL